MVLIFKLFVELYKHLLLNYIQWDSQPKIENDAYVASVFPDMQVTL